MDAHLLEKLKKYADLSFIHKDSQYKGASCAITENGEYFGMHVATINHVLDVAPEHAALIAAMQHKDYRVHTLLSYYPENTPLYPHVLQIIKEHEVKTGQKIIYKRIEKDEEVEVDVDRLLGFFESKNQPLYTENPLEVSGNTRSLTEFTSEEEALFACAKLGTETSFTKSPESTSYGASILTQEGNVYFSGQYSAEDERLGVHAEMCTAISVIQNSSLPIRALGIVSPKFVDRPCFVCGACEQFLREILRKQQKSITIYCFSFDGTRKETYELDAKGQW